MHQAQSTNFDLSESMKFNINEVAENIQSVLKIKVEPHIIVHKEGHEFSVKIVTHYRHEDFVAEASEKDFLRALHAAEKKITRSLLDKKKKVKLASRHDSSLNNIEEEE